MALKSTIWLNKPAIARAIRYFVSGSIIFSISGSILVSVEARVEARRKQDLRLDPALSKIEMEIS